MGNNGNARARLTDEELQSSVERLTQQRKGGDVITASARDFNDWKRKHGVDPESKVTSSLVICRGGIVGGGPLVCLLAQCSPVQQSTYREAVDTV